MSEEGSSTLRIVPLDMEKTFWHIWSAKFMAYGSLKGFDEILDREEEVPKVKPTEKKELIEYKRLTTANKVVYSALLLSCVDEIAFNIVKRAKAT